MAGLSWRPARRPERAPLEGDTTRLEPIDPARHANDLFAASAGAPALWNFLAYGPFDNQQAFTEWLEERAASDDPLFYAVIDRASGRAQGMASYLRFVPDHGVIEIGHIWFAPVLQRTRQATEAIYLMARNAFDELGYRRLEWKCDSLNLASRRAAERFGFVSEGIFRQHMVVKNRNRDTAWYAITDAEWPSRRAAFKAWLSPDNFDETGLQRESLSALRAQLEGKVGGDPR
jgi:RimJ/RimL family protein N-acetyltransferase